MPKAFIQGLDTAPLAPGAYAAGDYRMRISSHEEITAKSGRAGIAWSLVITDGPEDENGNVPLDRPFTVRLYYPQAGDPKKTADALSGKLRGFCEAAGIPVDSEGYDPDDGINCELGVRLRPQKDDPDYMEASKFFPA